MRESLATTSSSISVGGAAVLSTQPATNTRTAMWSVSAALAGTLLLTMLPVTMLVPVLKELVADRFDASSFWTHTFMSINMIGAIIAAPFGGILADRVNRRKHVLVAALLVDAALIGAMVWAPSLPMLLTIRFFEGSAHILALIAVMAIAADWATDGRRGRMMGVVGSSMMLGTAIGAPIGGRLGQVGPLRVLELGVGVALAAAVFAYFVVPEAPHRKRADRTGGFFRLVLRRRSLLIPYAYAFIDRFCVGLIVSTFVLYLADHFAMSPAERGSLLAMFLLPFALLCYPIGRLTDRFGRALPMCLGSIGFGVVYALYGVFPASALPTVMVLSGVLSAIMFAPNLAMCTDLAPPDERATAYAGFNVAGSLGFICGPLAGGIMLQILSTRLDELTAYQCAFLVGGLAEVVCAVVTLPFLLRLRRTGQTT